MEFLAYRLAISLSSSVGAVSLMIGQSRIYRDDKYKISHHCTGNVPFAKKYITEAILERRDVVSRVCRFVLAATVHALSCSLKNRLCAFKKQKLYNLKY